MVMEPIPLQPMRISNIFSQNQVPFKPSFDGHKLDESRVKYQGYRKVVEKTSY